ncbi:hypothetical protein JHK82_055770 [Glycine max]|nr:hypothetical protein JHK85_056594 [Glycine max]KAG5074399.1 hypothetical protein JHK84_055630 [Glycine max]KAG5077075.1 hypothetical protein JHK82_055770 [Glycine max]
MDATSSPFVSSRRMGVYDPIHQIRTWEENLGLKAYVQQLESCRLQVVQLEQEVDHAKQQVFTPSFWFVVIKLLVLDIVICCHYS